MHKHRLEAFSDGVIAIIITIMVLEMKVPHSPNLSALYPILPVLLCYVLSFVFVGLYWNNHHHMLHTVEEVSGGILWANLHWLFWLSLLPFVTGWMGENHFVELPTALYGFVLLMAAIAFNILQKTIIAAQGDDSLLEKAVTNDWKEKVPLAIYLVAIPVAFYEAWIANALYAVVAAMWIVPDKRIEKTLEEEKQQSEPDQDDATPTKKPE